MEPVSLEEARDIVIIVAGSIFVLVYLVKLISTVIVGFSTHTLLGVVKGTVKDEVNPLLDSTRETVKSVQETAQTLHGTTTFLGENMVSPVIRVYATMAGVRRAAGVITGLAGRRQQQQQEE